MVVCDTSVWVSYFNGYANRKTDMLDQFLYNGDIILLDLILLEILQGFKNDRDYKIARRLLAALPTEQALHPAAAVAAADYYRKLRKKGITVRATADMIIATWCIDKRVPLLFKDRDFDAIGKHLNLQNALLP